MRGKCGKMTHETQKDTKVDLLRALRERWASEEREEEESGGILATDAIGQEQQR